MNKIRTQKFKLVNNSQLSIHNDDTTANTERNNSNNRTNGLLNKLSRHYTTISHKIRARSPKKDMLKSTQKITTGKYNMKGSSSDDHRLEIGAPILISSTTLDADRFDVSEERLKMIGGGIANTNTLVKYDSNATNCPMPTSSTSSGSENEIYIDTRSSTPKSEEAKEKHTAYQNMPLQHEENALDSNSSQNTTDINDEKETDVTQSNYHHKQLSKSTQNLQRSELKVYLHKTPSMNLKNTTTAARPSVVDYFNICNDNLPKLPEIYGVSKFSLESIDYEENDADKENSSPSLIISPKNRSDPNPSTTSYKQQKGANHNFLGQRKLFQSADNLHQRKTQRRSVMFRSNLALNHCNNNAIPSKDTTLLNYNHNILDLKSVSCQSLNTQALFMSIDELNEITRQINESEEFTQAIDLEYCTHRDQLKPSERRITLLKNKNSRLVHLAHNTERIKKGWCDMKHWLESEGAKIRDVVHRQPLVQRTAPLKAHVIHVDNTKSSNIDRIILTSKISPQTDAEVAILDDNTSHQVLPVQIINELNNSNSNDVIENNELNSTLSDSSKRLQTIQKTDVEGQNGFEELRRYVKQGGDFGKELILILQERIDSELVYSKSLSKIANKLNKACRDLPGTLAEAWRSVATEMESRSDVHRQLSASLNDEIVKPLKSISENHHKSRKSVESNVDKASRVLLEWRISEAKAKKASHTAARENEKLQDAMLDVRIQKSPSIALLHQGSNKVAAEKEIKSAEKDCAKLDNKRKKAEEAVKRADVEYYTLCVRAERARVDWEMAVLRGSTLLQTIENQRLINIKNFVTNYHRLTASINPILEGVVQRLQPQVEACNVIKDMQIIKNIRRNAEGPSEQLLPDFYCEHTTLAMNRERRKHALIKLLQLVKTDLERERRSRNGIKNLSQSLSNQQNCNIADKLYHIRSMLTYLEGARFKLHSVLLELDHKPRSSHPLAQHIQITRDRTGLQQSILKVPIWLKNNDRINSNGTGNDDNSDYDSISQNNTNISTMNISYIENVRPIVDEPLTQAFSRSKSNIENFSSKSPPCLNGVRDKTKLSVTGQNYNDVCSDRGQADGGSNQQDSDFDEFSSQDEEGEAISNHLNTEKKIITDKLTNGCGEINGSIDILDGNKYYQNTVDIELNQSNNINKVPIVLSRCKALYNYTPKLYDELELSPGDIIEVHAKQDDGWWLGALRNQIGIFPATYVEEIA